MNAEIKKRFDALETRRQSLTSRVRALTPAQQTAHPDPKAFSPLEVLKHFALAENGNLQFLRNTPPASLQGQKPRLRFVYHKVLSSMQSAEKRVGTVPYMVPRGALTVEDADRSWASARAELAGFLEPMDSLDDPFCKFMFLFGTGSVGDYLALMEAHMHYHETRFPE
ncbi:MAG: DinB family protein [Fimbriimonadaceae bacterium]